MSGPDWSVVVSLSWLTVDSHPACLLLPCWSWAGHCQVLGAYKYTGLNLRSSFYNIVSFRSICVTIFCVDRFTNPVACMNVPLEGRLLGHLGHFFSSVLLSLPPQSEPPLLGGGSSQTLPLFWYPPHPLWHWLQAVHWPQLPDTLIKKEYLVTWCE